MIDVHTLLIHITQRNTPGEKNLADPSVSDCVTEIKDWSDKEVYFNIWFSSLR